MKKYATDYNKQYKHKTITRDEYSRLVMKTNQKLIKYKEVIKKRAANVNLETLEGRYEIKYCNGQLTFINNSLNRVNRIAIKMELSKKIKLKLRTTDYEFLVEWSEYK